MVLQGNVPLDSYCCWKKSCDQQLRLIVYPHDLQGFKNIPFDVSTVPYSGAATTTRPPDDPTKDGQVSCAKSWDWQSSRSPPRNSTLLHVHLVVFTFFSAGSLGRPVFGVVAAGAPWMTLFGFGWFGFGVWKGSYTSENQHIHWKIPQFQ